MTRVFLDWNATAPLRPEARAAMIAAMDLVGNPSSVHAEGRAAKALVEKARAQVAAAFGAEGADVVFTSGATEAAALACSGRGLSAAAVEHDAVSAWITEDLGVDGFGRVDVRDPSVSALQLANSETGVVQDLPQGLAVVDATQGFGKLPFAFNWAGCGMALISAHKVGGPKGVGALVMKRGTDLAAQIKGGGQEMGRRSGTENLIGIAGFGAAAEAAARDLAAGLWDRVGELRNILETSIAAHAEEVIFFGKDSVGETGSAGGAQGVKAGGKPGETGSTAQSAAPKRLPNTSCFAIPGWKGETQVMQMDLKGFAVSAGSACSSGKVRASRVLLAMGCDEGLASSALRVSLGPLTREEDVLRFAEAWGKTYARHRSRAA